MDAQTISIVIAILGFGLLFGAFLYAAPWRW